MLRLIKRYQQLAKIIRIKFQILKDDVNHFFEEQSFIFLNEITLHN